MVLDCLPQSQGLDPYLPQVTATQAEAGVGLTLAGAVGAVRNRTALWQPPAMGRRKGLMQVVLSRPGAVRGPRCFTQQFTPLSCGGCALRGSVLGKGNLAALFARQQFLPLEKPRHLSFHSRHPATWLLCSSRFFV